MNNDDPNLLMSLIEVGKLRDRSPKTLQKHVARGLLPAVKIGPLWVVHRAAAMTYLLPVKGRPKGIKDKQSRKPKGATK